ATVAAVENGEDPSPALDLTVATIAVTADAANSADAEADTGGAPVRGPSQQPAVLVAPGDAGATTLRAAPLFSGAAVRRDMIKLLVEGEAGFGTGGVFAGGAGAGIRLGDFVELTARARVLPFDE